MRRSSPSKFSNRTRSSNPRTSVLGSQPARAARLQQARDGEIAPRYLRAHLPEPDYTRPLLEVLPEHRQRILDKLTVLYGRDVAEQWLPRIATGDAIEPKAIMLTSKLAASMSNAHGGSTDHAPSQSDRPPGSFISAEPAREAGGDGGFEGGFEAGFVGRTVADMERDLIIGTLEHCLGNRTHAANILGISIRTLRNKLKQDAGEGMRVPPSAMQQQPYA